jgi:NAD(P)-dependent dehydrogenase (short-subunit alcohol dehydrogenase family)
METKARTSEPDARSPKPLLGRVALVTGGSRGLGAAIAKELADSGATVIVNYHHGAEPATHVRRANRSGWRESIRRAV